MVGEACPGEGRGQAIHVFSGTGHPRLLFVLAAKTSMGAKSRHDDEVRGASRTDSVVSINLLRRNQAALGVSSPVRNARS
jgi:hypothetical protein